MLRRLALLIFLLAPMAVLAQAVTIRMMGGQAQGIPPKEATDARSQARRAVFEAFARRNPGIRVVNAGGLQLEGDLDEAMFLMSMASDTAPDIFYVNLRQYYNYIEQGFCRPLDEFIKRDPRALAQTNPIILKVLRSYDGQVYAMPFYQVAMGLYFRKDYFLQAGLDPAKPPQNWDEFYKACQAIVEKTGKQGFAFSTGPGYFWKEFLWEAGGEVVTPAERGYSKAAIATPQAAKAVDFFRKLVNDKWVGADGKTYGPAAYIAPSVTPDVREGKVAMWFGYTNDVVLTTIDVDPTKIGIAATPAGPAGHANEINAGMWAINASITDPKRLEACWKFIQFFSGVEAARVSTERFVDSGLGNLVNPVYLKKFGYSDILGQVDPRWVKANEELFKNGHPEPYGRNTQQVYLILDHALDQARLEPKTPALSILQGATKEMNEKLLGYTPQKVLIQQRAWAMGILSSLLFVICALSVRAYLRYRRREAPIVEDRLPAGTRRGLIYRFMLWCLLPAALSVLVWSYYPLLKGLVIAFQDYKIAKGATWVGVDNFIAVFTQPIFYQSLWNSFVYVGLSLLIGFFIPIFLALALNEIPVGGTFFRTVFYLPAMTSTIIVSLLWRQFYDKTDHGLLNQLLAPVIGMMNPLVSWLHWAPIKPTHDWLGDPSLAMFAVVLPGIWAAAGPGSILYLAALKNIPHERYEAADIDGASWVSKVRYITLPGLKPLILINLLGVFIAGFKAMENIFVLTNGGPLYATHTIGLEVWENAFMYLRFGYATAAAWVMGAILIGFTLIQIKTLMKMRFTTAKL